MAEDPSLLGVFREHVPCPQRFSALPDLEGRLHQLWHRGRQAWPSLALTAPAFIRHLAARLPEDRGPEEALAALQAEDLYLACACLLQLPGALEAFDKRVLGQVPPALARMQLSEARMAEVLQILRARLLVATPERPARIADYGGRGPLQGWVRVSAMREALALLRKKDEQLDGGQNEAIQEIAGAADPELDYLRGRYRAEFAGAFKEALTLLTSEQRNLLRMAFVDGLSGPQIGGLFQVNRSTVTRKLQAARDDLQEHVRRLLHERLRLSGSELDSMMRLLRSQLDVSIVTYLRGPAT